MFSVQVKPFEFFEKMIHTASGMSTRMLESAPFIILKNPRVQSVCGLVALGYGVSQLQTGHYLCRVGLSIGGIILYHAAPLQFRDRR